MYSRRVVSYKRKYVHEVLVNPFKLAQDKSVVRLTDRPDMTIAVDWDVKQQTKPKKSDSKFQSKLYPGGSITGVRMVHCSCEVIA